MTRVLLGGGWVIALLGLSTSLWLGMRGAKSGSQEAPDDYSVADERA